MKTSTIAIAAVIAVVVGICAVSFASAYNTGNRLTNNIITTNNVNKSILSRVTTSIIETAQVPAMQRDDITKVIEAAVEGRFGEDGSQAVFQMIQEDNPQIDSAVYIQLQRVIEAGRRDFDDAQEKLEDQKRVYATAVGSLWTGTWMGIAGYDKDFLDAYPVIVNARTEEAYTTGRDEPIQLN